jgi:hypothetical protein
MEKQTPRKQRREPEMFVLVAEYESSGLTRQDFCEQHNLKLATFTYWRTKYLASKNEPATGFVSLVPEQKSPGINLHYGDVKLSFGAEVPMDYVVGLVRKLSTPC